MNTPRRIQFFMPMRKIPTVTKQQQKTQVGKDGKPYRYWDAHAMDCIARLRDGLVPHIPATPLRGPLRCVQKWIWLSKNAAKHGTYKVTRPDYDNMPGVLNDQMEKLGFYADDALIASGTTEKFWGSRPGIFVMLEEIKPEETEHAE